MNNWDCRSSGASLPAVRSWPKSISKRAIRSIRSYSSPQPHYLLKVQGMSMKNAGILDGDLVAVHRTPEVRNRQIVVARLENEVTVKRYRQEGTIVWLLPENTDFEPIRVDLKEQPMIIEGVVVGVLRRGKDVDAA